MRQDQSETRVAVGTEEGLRDEKSAVVNVTVPALKVSIAAPPTAAVGTPISYQITVTNTGSGPAENVRLTADFDPGLEHESKGNPVNLTLGTLQGGESKPIALVLTAKQVGPFTTRVTAVADGGLQDRAEHAVTVQQAPQPPQPRMTLALDGPAKRYKDRPADFILRVANAGDVPLTNVVVRDRLPPELAFVSAGQGGGIVGGDVVWNVGALQPREERVLNLTVRANQLSPAAVQQA